MKSGWKVDLICRKSRPFSVAEFERRALRDLAGASIYVASAEDIVLSKLEWAKLSDSQRQLEDVAGVLRIQQSDIDHTYIEKWARELGILEQWENAKALAD